MICKGCEVHLLTNLAEGNLTPRIVVGKRRSQYEASVEEMMDWLLTCGDHATQARLVEALLRWVASRPSSPQADRARPPARHG